MSEEQMAQSAGSRRAYQPPKLVQYGGLTELTGGMPFPQWGPMDNGGKILGAGDDLSSFLPGSPFVARPR
jgi:hypothetical protein